MPRLQKGRLYEASGAFYVQFYQNEDGKKSRNSHRLCLKDDQHYAVNSKAVKLLRDAFMLKVNSGSHSNTGNNKVVEFWELTYLPYAKEALRPSTASGYEKLWKGVMKAHFSGRTLEEYRTHHGSEFLTKLASEKKYGRRSIQHVRSLASGVFTHAVNKGLLEANPWREVKVLAKVKEPGETPHYTLEEAEDIISSLVDCVDGQLIFALAFFIGLRPEEIAGLKWEDVDENFIHIRRTVVSGLLGPTKTPESAATLPLIQPVKGLFSLWRERCGGRVTAGWLFPNRMGGPVNLVSFARRFFKPAIEKWNRENPDNKHQWKGLYAARRGAGTILTELTGNLVAAQELLRHKSLTTTALHYKKKTENSLSAGMKLLEERASKS